MRHLHPSWPPILLSRLFPKTAFPGTRSAPFLCEDQELSSHIQICPSEKLTLDMGILATIAVCSFSNTPKKRITITEPDRNYVRRSPAWSVAGRLSLRYLIEKLSLEWQFGHTKSFSACPDQYILPHLLQCTDRLFLWYSFCLAFSSKIFSLSIISSPSDRIAAECQKPAPADLVVI